MLASCQLTGDHCDAHFFPSSHNVTNQALIMSPPHSLFFHKRAICDTFTSTTRNFPSIVFHLEYLRAAGRVESNYQKESKMSCLCSQQSHARLGVKDNVMSAEHIPIHQRGCPATWWNHLQERTSTVHFRGHWRTP